ncbi:hypothetical protein ACJIZ3_014185 [Penstemon smallii]|uniref:DUF4220 domain-containing protein n=1 Tax=Penstemon smallii TaxID=265156 RepID=A0ABD3RKS0_9LAMI
MKQNQLVNSKHNINMTQENQPRNITQIRALVLVSLFCQVFLVSTGSRRKYITSIKFINSKLLAGCIWLAYQAADYFATLALGNLARSQSYSKYSVHDPSYVIISFWAAFLLMHLGGPDTITAYALADNELWLRHGLQLVGQVAVALYVIIKSWNDEFVNYMTIGILVAGVIKYGERTWVLYSASRDRYRESMVSPPNPGPAYAKFMEEYISREAEGYIVDVVDAIEKVSSSTFSQLDHGKINQIIPDAKILQEADYFFGTFKQLFADLILSVQDKEISLDFFTKLEWDNAFGIIEVELGLIYDLLYTKVSILYSPLACLRAISLLCTVTVSITFLIIPKDLYPDTDVIITYVLLSFAVCLEIYAIIILLSSDRTMIWLSRESTTSPFSGCLKDQILSAVYFTLPLLRYLLIIPSKKRWSNAMGQHNVLKLCLKDKPKFCILPYTNKYKLKINLWVEKYLFINTVSISNDLKALIFKELKRRATATTEQPNEQSGRYRSDIELLKEVGCFDMNEGEIEFEQSVLVWHIATDLCYRAEEDRTRKNESVEDKLKSKREMCQSLSDYMMYLLVMSPIMLPSGIGQIRFQDTCAEAAEFFEELKLRKIDACDNLRQVQIRVPPSKVKGDRSKSLLFEACGLADFLKEDGQKWDKIFEAWLDLLTFAAAKSRWNDHAEKLSQGGELLTHVWLLMAHFGMTDQFQIAQGYVRAKLDIS